MVRNKLPPTVSKAVRVVSKLLRARQRTLAKEEELLAQLKKESSLLAQQSEEQKSAPALARDEERIATKHGHRVGGSSSSSAAAHSPPRLADILTAAPVSSSSDVTSAGASGSSGSSGVSAAQAARNRDRRMLDEIQTLEGFAFVSRILPAHRMMQPAAAQEADDTTGAKVNFLRESLDREIKTIARAESKSRKKRAMSSSAAAADEDLPSELIFSCAVDNLMLNKWNYHLSSEQRNTFSPSAAAASISTQTLAAASAAAEDSASASSTLQQLLRQSAASPAVLPFFGGPATPSAVVPQRSPFLCFVSAVLRVPLHAEIVSGSPDGHEVLTPRRNSSNSLGGAASAGSRRGDEVAADIRRVSGWDQHEHEQKRAAAAARQQDEAQQAHHDSTVPQPAPASAAPSAPELEQRVAELADYWNQVMTREQRAAVAKLALEEQRRGLFDFESSSERLLSKPFWTSSRSVSR
jgi:hypothetical protein